MNPRARILLFVIFGLVIAQVVIRAFNRPQSTREREAEIRKLATEQACKILVEAKLVASCAVVQQQGKGE